MFDKKGEDGDKTRLAIYPSIPPASWSTPVICIGICLLLPYHFLWIGHVTRDESGIWPL